MRFRRGKLLPALLAAAALMACGPSLEPLPEIQEVIGGAEAGDEASLEKLTLYFSSPVDGEAQLALETLIKYGEKSLPYLITALEDKDLTNAEFAAGALGNIGDQRAVDPLMDALDRPGFPRYVAVWALGEIKDDRALPRLFSLLGDENPEVRKYATRALIKYGPQVATRGVEALDDPDPWVRHYAVRVLGQVGEAGSAGPIAARYATLDPEAALWALGKLGGKEAFPVIAREAVSGDWKVRLEAVKALGEIKDDRAVTLLEDALEDEEWIIREWAARSLEHVTKVRWTYRDKNGELVYPYNLYR